MTVLYADALKYLSDCCGAAGLGVLFGLLMSPLRGLPKRTVISFFLYILVGALEGALMTLFICGATYCRGPRLFLFVGAALGLCCYKLTVEPWLDLAASFAKRLLHFAFCGFAWVFERVLWRPLGRLLSFAAKPLVLLKKQTKMVYNKSKARRMARRKEESDGDRQEHKAPIKAAAKT